jgi:hypothetical protein
MTRSDICSKPPPICVAAAAAAAAVLAAQMIFFSPCDPCPQDFFVLSWTMHDMLSFVAMCDLFWFCPKSK